MTIPVPFRIVKRGGLKEMQLPEAAPPPCRADSTLVTMVYCALLHDPRHAAHLARAGHRRGDPGQEAGAGGDTGEFNGAVSAGTESAEIQSIGLNQMGQAAACPDGVVLTLSRERPRRFFC